VARLRAGNENQMNEPANVDQTGLDTQTKTTLGFVPPPKCPIGRFARAHV